MTEGNSSDGARPSWRARRPGDLMRLQQAERDGHPFLLTRDADDLQRIIVLPKEAERITLGRDPGCTIIIDWDNSVSRVHAEMECLGVPWTVVDDGLSRNGTFVNGRRIISRTRLADGDVVSIGSSQLEFRQPRTSPTDSTVVRSDGPAIEITPAQRRVLIALARPYAAGPAYAVPATNQEIAAELVVSLDAVKATLRILFVKFALADMPQNQKRAKLVERALELGVITEPELAR